MILSEQHSMIRALARKFAETELTPEILDKVEETAVFPQEVLDKMAEVGFFGIKVPKSMGGQGGDTLGYMLVMEEICRVSAVAGVYVSSANSLSSGPIMMAGTPDQIEKYLKPVVTGKKRLCFALTEPGAGSDASGILDKTREICTKMENSKEKEAVSVIDRAKAYIEKNFRKDISLDDVSREVDISPYYFSKLFKQETGKNFIEHLTEIRLKNARELLQNSQLSIKEICAQSGYSDPNYFSRIFKKYEGVTPSEFRERLG